MKAFYASKQGWFIFGLVELEHIHKFNSNQQEQYYQQKRII